MQHDKVRQSLGCLEICQELNWAGFIVTIIVTAVEQELSYVFFMASPLL